MPSSSFRGSSFIQCESKLSLATEYISSTSSIITNNSIIDSQITTCALSFISFPSTSVTTNYQKEKTTLTFSSDYLISSNILNKTTNSKSQSQQSNMLPLRALLSKSSNLSS